MRSMAVKLTIDVRASLVKLSRAASNALSVFTNIGDMPSLPAIGSAAHSALLADVERIIAQGSSGRFSNIIETIYAEATRQARDRFFTFMSITGIIFYNLFLFADALIIPDQLWLFVVLQLGIVTPLAVVMVGLVIKGKLDADVTSIIVLAAMMAATLVGLRMIEGQYAMLMACALNLLIVSSNLFVAIAFAWSVIYTIIRSPRD